jgi:signal peptidase I
MSERDERTTSALGPEPDVADSRVRDDERWRLDGRAPDTGWAGDDDVPSSPPPPAPPFSWPPGPPAFPGETQREEPAHHHRHPLDRLTGKLPPHVRVVVDWVVTIVGAIAIVLAVKAWVVNPYRIPSSSMEPTLHCARAATEPGCEARFSDRVLANRFIYHFRDPKRGEIVVFKTPRQAKIKCGEGGTFVKRIIGLPRETVQVRLIRGAAYVYIDGKKLDEPYIQRDRRDIGPAKTYHVPAGSYFMMGDNRAQSCDSRQWGSVPRKNLIGPVFMTYWPPNRISFR